MVCWFGLLLFLSCFMSKFLYHVGGVFKLELFLPEEYPMAAPKVTLFFISLSLIFVYPETFIGSCLLLVYVVAQSLSYQFLQQEANLNLTFVVWWLCSILMCDQQLCCMLSLFFFLFFEGSFHYFSIYILHRMIMMALHHLVTLVQNVLVLFLFGML